MIVQWFLKIYFVTQFVKSLFISSVLSLVHTIKELLASFHTSFIYIKNILRYTHQIRKVGKAALRLDRTFVKQHRFKVGIIFVFLVCSCSSTISFILTTTILELNSKKNGRAKENWSASWHCISWESIMWLKLRQWTRKLHQNRTP